MRLTPAILLLCIFLAPISAELLLVDQAENVLSWGTNNGGEFPGATAQISVVEDADRGPCVRGQFTFSADSRYAGVEWRGSLPQATAVGFWVKTASHSSVMVRVRDATEQEHMSGATITRGEWTRVEIPLQSERFSAHWGGLNDGKLHFPVQKVLIALNRGPDESEVLVSDLHAAVDSAKPADGWLVLFEPRVPSGIAMRGEKAQYVVHVLNRLDTQATGSLHIEACEPGGRPQTLQRCPLALGGWERREISLILPTDRLGYKRLSAVIEQDGEKRYETVSGIAVVPRPRHYGRSAPDCYFGIQHVQDMEAAERLGAKSVRQAPGWRWAEPWEGHVKWDDYLDPIFQQTEDHHMQMLFTAQAIAPSWIQWEDPDRPGVSSLPDPKRLSEWRRFVQQVAERYKGKIAALEIQNEPDLTCAWQPGLPFQEGVDYYAELLKVGREGAKAGDPDVLIAGIDVSGGDFENGLTFSRGVMDKAGDAVDIYTGHPYASPRYFGPGLHPKWPIVNEIPGKCRAALDMMSEYGRPRRMWIGELGWGLQNTADPLSVYSMDFAACISQALICGKSVPGVEKFLYFTMAGCDEGGNEYGLTRGHPAYPLPAALAYASSAYILDGGEPVDLQQVTPELWRASFTNSRRSELIVAWWSDGDEVALRPPLSVPAGRWWDSFFTRLRPAGGIKVGRMPVYWVLPLAATGPDPAFLDEVTAHAAVPVTIKSAFVAARDRLGFRLTNKSGIDQTVDVRVAGTTRQLQLPADAADALSTVQLPEPLPLGKSLALDVTVTCGGVSQTLTISDSLLPLGAPPPGLKVDGALDEWDPSKAVTLAGRGSILPPDPGIGWDGPSDLSVRANLAADAEALYFAAEVSDDVHAVPSAEQGNFWRSDSIQIAVDPFNDSVNQFDGNDVELGLVLPADGTPRTFVTYPPGAEQSKLQVAAKRKDGRTIYEARIPWSELGIPVPSPQQVLAINFIVNDNDGEGRGYWIGLTPGIGEGKSPVSYKGFIMGAE